MSLCQACETFGAKGGRHEAELKIVWYWSTYDRPIELRVCLCCWLAIAFRKKSDRRRFQCPSSTEKRYVYHIGGASDIGEQYWRALERSYKTSLFHQLGGPYDDGR